MAHRFIIDDQTGQLYKDFTGRRLTSAAEILKSERGLTPTLEFYLINVATDTGAVTAQTLTNAQLSVAIGSASTPPDSGFIKASFTQSGTLYESEQLNIESLTAASLESAFNSSIQPVYNVGGLTVDQIGPGKWLLTMKKVGAITGSPSLNVENSDPPSGVEVTLVTTGDFDTRAQWIISLAQLPVASIAGGSFSAVTSGSFSGLSSSIALNTTGMLAAIARNIKLFEFSVIHNNQVLHRSSVEINESLDPTSAGTVVVTSPSLFTLGSNAVNQGETIALSGGLTYDGTTLAAPFLPLAGGTMTGDVLFNDGVKAKFGTHSDLTIQHTGSDSVISDSSGTGGIKIDTNYLQIRNALGTESQAKFIENGAVELNYDNSKKFETTNTGATISGKLIVNGDLDVSGTTTTFNSTVVTVDDPVFTVGGDTAPTSSDNKDRGIEFRYFRSGESAKVGFFGYDNSEDAFTILTEATNNSEVFSGTLADLKCGKVLLEDGSESAPSVSFSSDTDTGFYRYGNDNIGITTNGIFRARFTNSGIFEHWGGINLRGGVLKNQDGSASAPSYTFYDDSNSGIFGGTDIIAFSTGGTEAARFDSSGDFIINNSNEIKNDTNHLRFSTGSQDNNNIVFKPNGTLQMILTDTGLLGIGGTPSEKLTVDGNIRINGDNKELYFSGNQAKFRTSSASSDVIFETGTTELLRLDGSASSINVPDDVKLKLGGGGDLQLYHDGFMSYIINDVGHLYIRNQTDDNDIIFQCDDGSGGTETYFFLDSSYADGYYTYTRFNDGGVIALGDARDLRLWHDPHLNDSYIRNSTNDLIIENHADDKDIIFKSDDGSGGVTEYFRLDGSDSNIFYSQDLIVKDSKRIKFGDNHDLQIFHNGTNNAIESHSGNFYFTNYADDSDIIFEASAGSASPTELLRLDGSTGNVGIGGVTNPDSPLELEVATVGSTQTRLAHFDHNPTGNTGSGFIRLSSGSTHAASLHIEQVSSGGGGLYGTYYDTNFINNGLSPTGPWQNINFVTNEAIRMTIGGGSQAGNVGIGTTSPSAPLDIVSSATGGTTIELDNTSTGGRNWTLYSSGSGNSFGAGNFALYDADAASIRFLIDSSGRLGVNTTSPSGTTTIHSALDCSSDFSTHNKYALNLHNLADDTDESIGISFGLSSSATAVGAAIAHERKGTGSYGDLYFLTKPNGGSATERMRIDSSGNVKIPDDGHLIFGNDSDFQIYHDGSNSYISDGGTGNLRIRSNSLRIEAPDSQNIAVFNEDSDVNLYHNGSKKFETTFDGFKCTGALQLTEISTPTATADHGKVYTKSDNKLYFQDGAGTEHEIAFV